MQSEKKIAGWTEKITGDYDLCSHLFVVFTRPTDLYPFLISYYNVKTFIRSLGTEYYMSTVAEATIRQLLVECIAVTVKEAQQQVSEPLPTQLYIELGAFGQNGKELSLNEIMPFLYRDGTFPKVVTIGIRGIKDGRVFIWILPSGHEYVSELSQTWNTPPGSGPFMCVGFMMPPLLWSRMRPFSLQDLTEAGEK